MIKDALGDRMKDYENISRIHLTKRMPVIIRIDGKAFHSFTKGFERPFDDILISAMQETAKYLCENIMGCKLAYTQSDEISLLLVDYDTIETQPWFDNNLQKLVSVAASMATMAFNYFFQMTIMNDYGPNDYPGIPYWSNKSIPCEGYPSWKEDYGYFKLAMFDARAFVLPKEEVCNYFIWRQKDATRNSINMVAQSEFSHKELQGKSCDEVQDMLHEEKGINWNDYEIVYKRGSCIVKKEVQDERFDPKDGAFPIKRWVIDEDIPIFTQDRDYIDQYVMLE